ncbi:hypothetical protein BCR43DRAFT_491923 [Syncephalastrum racemosum]|uniref:FAD-binding domain-containing protein n=1 Tax=Syncephalastrum racemosum TaxID=13706 RepID=A0A1X2HCQ8_SYNRA|nr:hypothetical protein BCR43DRAFT_491923 [Syncephalastrum racemosum]
MTVDKPVLIIGGGLSGLALGNILQHHGIPYKIFERDTSPDMRSQGWSISVRDLCLGPLEDTIDPAKFATLGSTSAVNPAMPREYDIALVGAHTGTIFLKTSAAKNPSPMYRVNRRRFRAWLMDGLDIEWNKKLSELRETEHGNVSVTFEDGTQTEGCLVVGADGWRSRVCEHIVGKDTFWKATRPSALRALTAARRMTEEEFAPFGELSRTVTMYFGGNKERSYRLFTCVADVDPTREDKYLVQWLLSCFDDTAPVHASNTERLAQAKAWSDSSLEGLAAAMVNGTPEGTEVTHLIIHERSPRVLEEADPGRSHRVTVIGDAAHAMTPYRGEGGNHAIRGAAELGKKLIDAYQENMRIEEAVAAYEKDMIKRGDEAVQASHFSAELFHRPSPEDGGEAMGRIFAERISGRIQNASERKKVQ